MLLNICVLLLFTQCKNATATEKAVTTESVEAAVTPPVVAVKTTAEIIDSTVLVKAKTTVARPMEEAETTTKKVAIKTATTIDKKAAPVATKKKKKKRAKIKFDGLVHKFGTIKTGDKVSHQFKFKNTGNAPLVIKSVDVSCGCTFPSYPFLPIEPGKEGAIDVTFDSEHKVGRQKPTVTVVTNGRPRTIKLNLEGFVE